MKSLRGIFMNDNLALKIENEILTEKRQKIIEEIDEKMKIEKELEQQLKLITKEAKGVYNQERENAEKIYNLSKKEIHHYREAVNNPYFARVDFAEKLGDVDSIYIGKQGISSTKDGEEIVVDWRSPVADLYYSTVGGEVHYRAPVGEIEGELLLKRKFLFNKEVLDRIFDESINKLIINREEGLELVDEFLKMNLEKSRGKKLKEVVATIQKEQNNIIRWPKNLPIIVQGSAGSGKTTIALHRLAYLLYKHKESMDGKDILVLAPNKLFIGYISDILPNLGASDVKETTFEDLIIDKLKLKVKVKTKDDKLKSIMEMDDNKEKEYIVNSSKLKGSLSFKKIIDRYITLLESSALDIDDITIKGYILFSKREITRLYLKDLKSYPINKRKDEIKRYFNLKLKEKVQSLLLQVDRQWDLKIRDIKKKFDDSEERRKILREIYNDRDELKSYINHEAKREMNEYFKNWRGITPNDIYLNLFKDKEMFEMANCNIIPTSLASYIQKETIKNIESGIIDEDDLASLLYIYILLEGVEEQWKFKHIFVDEAQDYSPFQIYLINKLSKGNSITLVGDLAQGIYYYKGIRKWDDIIEGVFDGKASYIDLTQSYRSTVEIIDFAQYVLDVQNLGLKSAKPVLRHGQIPDVKITVSKKETVLLIKEIINEIKSKGKNSIAIITRTYREGKNLEKELKKNREINFALIKGNENQTPDVDVVIIPSYLTKGLEFDCTIIYNPLDENYTEDILNHRLLYVALTRALHYEYIISEGKVNRNIKF